ncbi:MAG TPA: ThuA domain-containing protein [Pirellulales bacterium]|nr:ThuA domain-containing protein [Pirellulales bacterium]
MQPHFKTSIRSSFLLAAYLTAVAAAPAEEPRARRLLLLSQGPDGHPPATHEYEAGLKILQKCLAKSPGLEVTLERADEPWEAGPAMLEHADGAVIFLSEGAKWVQNDPRRLDALARLAARGGGLVAVHWGLGTKDAEPIDAYLKLLGGCHGGPDRRYKVVETTIHPARPRHPIATGIERLALRDEFYYRLKFIQPADQVHPVLTVPIEGREETVAWAWQRPDGGRSFGFSGLHFHDNWRLPAYRRVMTQGTLWAMRLPIPEGGANVDVDEADLQLGDAASTTNK